MHIQLQHKPHLSWHDCEVVVIYNRSEAPDAWKKNHPNSDWKHVLEARPHWHVGKSVLFSSHSDSSLPQQLILWLGDQPKASDWVAGIQHIWEVLPSIRPNHVHWTIEQIHIQDRDVAWVVRLLALQNFHKNYQLLDYKTAEKNPTWQAKDITLDFADAKGYQSIVSQANAIAYGQQWTRNLGNHPPNVCTIEYLVDEAKRLGHESSNIKVEVLGRKELEKLQAGAWLAVAKGSVQEPKLIALHYHPSQSYNKHPFVLVGKGLVFDSGGLSLKPANAMVGMKYDMCGAATVLGTIAAIAKLQLPIHIIGIMACAENMPSGHSYRPDDIVTTMSGQTVEVDNTDAEGRLVLCDALTYVEQFSPHAVIDIATLTGACVVALGEVYSGLFSNDLPLAKALQDAGDLIHDRAWMMPCEDDYQSLLDSPFADMRNTGKGGGAGAITAACFLSRFTKKYRWAHLDVAGSATLGKQTGLASGRPVPLLSQFFIQQVKAHEEK